MEKEKRKSGKLRVAFSPANFENEATIDLKANNSWCLGHALLLALSVETHR
jgi:hypothetical protein